MGYYAPLLTKRQSEVKHCFSEDKSSRPPARDRPGLAKAAQIAQRAVVLSGPPSRVYGPPELAGRMLRG